MIRKAKTEDIERIIELSSFASRQNWKRFFSKDKAKYLSYAFLNLYNNFHQENLKYYYVYEDENIIKGFINYSIKEEKVYLKKLAVDYFFENEDILNKMYIEFEQQAIKANMQIIYIWVITKDKERIDFLNNKHFIQDNTRRYLDNTIILEQLYYKKLIK